MSLDASRRRTVRVAFLLLSALLPFRVLAQSGGGGARPRVATVLYLSYEAPTAPPFDAAALHRGAWDRLAAELQACGYDATPRSAIEPFVYKHKARTSLGISSEFLHEISIALDAERILIADLAIHPDRLLLSTRGTRTATGELLWADIEEEQLPPDFAAGSDSSAAGWLDAVSPACGRVAGRWVERFPSAGAVQLFLLPVRTAGVEAAAAELVSKFLLFSLLESPWRLEDPGVTFSRLRDAGIDPARLDRRARPHLTSGRGPCALLIGDISAYDISASHTQNPFVDEAPSATHRLALSALALSLRLIDGESGRVLWAATEYIDAPRVRGAFGLMRNQSLSSRIRPTTDRLVQAASTIE